jgi:hypothetical protein
MSTQTVWRSAAAALAAALLAAPAPAAELDPHVPADATVVASVDVRRVAAAPFVRDHVLPLLARDPSGKADLERALVTGGLPLDAVDRVTLAASGFRADKVLVIAHGRFDPARERAAAEELARKDPERCKVHVEDGLVVCESRLGRATQFTVVAGPDTALVSTARELVVAAAKRSGRQPAALDPNLQALIDKADARHAVWFAALAPPELKKQLAKGQDTAVVADKILAISGDLDVDQDLRGSVRIHTADPKSAERVAEMLDAARGLVKLLLQSNSDYAEALLPVVDGVKIGTRQAVVDLGVRVTGDMLEKRGKKGPSGRPTNR